MSPAEDSNQTLNTNTPSPTNPDCCNKVRWWPLWLLGGLILLFLITIIILRGLCSDVWYINLLKLNNKLCNQSGVTADTGRTIRPGLALEGNSLTIVGGNTITLPTKEGPEGKEGPKGQTGSKGTTGAKGETGSTGPAGPTDPCVTTGTYFCQNGNNYGTLAVLGTSDAQDLQVVTGGQPSVLVDVQGNVSLNNQASTDVLFQPGFVSSQSNLVIPTQMVLPTAPSLLTDSDSNILQVSGAVLNDSDNNIGWVSSSTLTNVDYNLLFALGSTITNGNGLTGQFIGSTISDTYDLLGMVGDSSISLSNGVMGSVTDSMLQNANQVFVGLTNGSVVGNLASVDDSMIRADNSAVNGVSESIIQAFGSTVTTATSSDIYVSDSSVTNVSQSSISVTGNTSVDSISNSTINGRSDSIINDVVDSRLFISGSSTVNGLGTSNVYVGGASTVTDGSTLNGIIHFGSNVTNSNNFNGSISVCNIDGSATLHGRFINCDITDSARLIGSFDEATITNSVGVVGVVGESIITDSNGITGQIGFGSNIINSGTLTGSFYADNFDNVVETIGHYQFVDGTNVNGLLGVIHDSEINDTYRNIINGARFDIDDVTDSLIVGSDSTLSGLGNSFFIGTNATISDPGAGDYDFALIGTNVAGTVNTRISNKGADSWLNGVSGGNVGIGTTTPGQKLDVAGTVRQSNAINCNVSTNASGDLQCASDERLKDVQGLYMGGLTELSAINTIKFNYKGEDYTHVGFSAQNIQAVLPEATPTQGNGYLGLDSNAIVALLVNSVKEQNGQIDGINAQLADKGVRIESISDELRVLADRVDKHDEAIQELRNELKELKKQLQTTPAQPTTSQP